MYFIKYKCLYSNQLSKGQVCWIIWECLFTQTFITIEIMQKIIQKKIVFSAMIRCCLFRFALVYQFQVLNPSPPIGQATTAPLSEAEISTYHFGSQLYRKERAFSLCDLQPNSQWMSFLRFTSILNIYYLFKEKLRA